MALLTIEIGTRTYNYYRKKLKPIFNNHLFTWLNVVVEFYLYYKCIRFTLKKYFVAGFDSKILLKYGLKCGDQNRK